MPTSKLDKLYGENIIFALLAERDTKRECRLRRTKKATLLQGDTGYSPSRRFARSAPCEQAPRSPSGECEPDSASLCSRNAIQSESVASRERKKQPVARRHPGIRLREDSHTLRLVSKLPDLRVANVNRTPLRFARGTRYKARVSPPENEKSNQLQGDTTRRSHSRLSLPTLARRNILLALRRKALQKRYSIVFA